MDREVYYPDAPPEQTQGLDWAYKEFKRLTDILVEEFKRVTDALIDPEVFNQLLSDVETAKEDIVSIKDTLTTLENTIELQGTAIETLQNDFNGLSDSFGELETLATSLRDGYGPKWQTVIETWGNAGDLWGDYYLGVKDLGRLLWQTRKEVNKALGLRSLLESQIKVEFKKLDRVTWDDFPD